MVVDNPWPRRGGSLLLREATERDVEHLLTFRNDPEVNRFMLRTHVDPEMFRREWLAVPGSGTDFSCVAEREGSVVATRKCGPRAPCASSTALRSGAAPAGARAHAAPGRGG